MADTEDPHIRTVFVAGAGGFIGSRLTEILARTPGIHVIAGYRRQPNRMHSQGVEIRVCDATDVKAVSAATRGVDYVVNCVAGNGRSMMAATQALCDAARRMPPRRIVHLSSMAVYGDVTGTVSEQADLIAPCSAYGDAKRTCERIVTTYVRDGGDAVILRPGCVYGPGSRQWTAGLARLLRAGRAGDFGAAGDGVCNLVYVDDLVAAIQAAMSLPADAGRVGRARADAARAFNVVCADPPTWNAYLTAFARALGATPVRRLSARRLAVESRIVAPALRMAAIATRMAHLPAGWIPEAITPSLAGLLRQDIRLDGAAAAEAFRLTDTTLDEGLAASVRWFGPTPKRPLPQPEPALEAGQG